MRATVVSVMHVGISRETICLYFVHYRLESLLGASLGLYTLTCELLTIPLYPMPCQKYCTPRAEYADAVYRPPSQVPRVKRVMSYVRGRHRDQVPNPSSISFITRVLESVPTSPRQSSSSIMQSLSHVANSEVRWCVLRASAHRREGGLVCSLRTSWRQRRRRRGLYCGLA